MKELLIKATEYTPEIDFNKDTCIFSVSGMSRPENVRVFYDPMLTWFKEFVDETINNKSKRKVVANFKMTYFNSASAKKIWDFLSLLEKIDRAGIDLDINWYYEEDDETILEGGEELSGAIELKFNFIEYPAED